MEGVEVNISCQTEDLGNVTPTLRLTGLGLAAQTKAGVETVLHIAIVLDVLTTDMVGYHSTQSEIICCQQSRDCLSEKYCYKIQNMRVQ